MASHGDSDAEEQDQQELLTEALEQIIKQNQQSAKLGESILAKVDAIAADVHDLKASNQGSRGAPTAASPM